MRLRLTIALALFALLIAACTDDDADLTTTTMVLTETTIGDGNGNGDTTTTLGSDNGPTTTLRGAAVAEFDLVHTETTDNGDIVHIVIPRAGYTDIDIENFIRDYKTNNPDLWGMELFDDADAQDAFTIPESGRSEDQQDLVNEHHLVTLTEGDTLIWRARFSSLGQSSLGS